MADQLWSPGKVAAEVTPIGDIAAGGYRITIRARILNKSDIRSWMNESGCGKRLFFECMDHTGEIRCVGFNKQADALNETINTNGTYVITNLRARRITEENKKKYLITSTPDINTSSRSATKHDFELVLSLGSQITSCNEESLPNRADRLQKIGDLRNLVQPGEKVMVDVIGVCVHVSERKENSLPCGKESRQYGKDIRVDLRLVDDSTEGENGITLTLWGNQACELAEVPPFVVVSKSVRLSRNNDGTLNSGDTNMIQVDPDLLRGYELMKWYGDAQK